MSDKEDLKEFATKQPSRIKPHIRGGLAGAALTGAAYVAANNPEIRDAAGKAVDWAKEKAGQVGSWMKDKADDFEKNLDKKANPASNSKEEKPTELPKNDVPTKSETPPAGSAAAKMSFNQAYAKAREMAKSAGKDPNIAQFKFDRGGGEKVYQAAATKKDYVPMSKQYKVDIGSEPKTSTSNTTSTNSDTLKPVDTSTMGPTKLTGPEDQGPTNAKWYGDPNRKPGNPEESESGGKKRKMSEEHLIRDTILEVVSREQLAKSGLTLGQYLNKQRGLTAIKGGANDPNSAKFKGPATSSAAGKTMVGDTNKTNLILPNKLAGRNQASDAAAASSSERGIRSYSGGNIDTSKFNAPGGNRAPLPTTSEFKPSTGPVSPDTDKNDTHIAKIKEPMPQRPPNDYKDYDSLTHRYEIGTVKTPSVVNVRRTEVAPDPGKFELKPESESGGKKKKMSEETNPLIAAFLKLQETKAANMFEAAKKAKKDYDGDGKVESSKDEVWGSRFKAAKAAGKMEEGSMMDPNDPSVQGGSDVTTTPVKSVKPVAPKKVDGDPSYQGSGDVTMSGKSSTPAQTTAATSGPSTADKKALDAKVKTIAKEEVEFSQAEIDHINSFFEQVAPSRAEPTKSVNPSVSNISLTDDTLEEGRPKKNPQPETTERDARQHIQVIAGRAAAGNTLDFPHNDGSKSKITPAMGRKITSHLQGLKPAERQAAVNRMHASSEGLKI